MTLAPDVPGLTPDWGSRVQAPSAALEGQVLGEKPDAQTTTDSNQGGAGWVEDLAYVVGPPKPAFQGEDSTEKGTQQWTPGSLPRRWKLLVEPLALTQAELWTAEVSVCAPGPPSTLAHPPAPSLLSTLGAQLPPQGRDMHSRAELHHCYRKG